LILALNDKQSVQVSRETPHPTNVIHNFPIIARWSIVAFIIAPTVLWLYLHWPAKCAYAGFAKTDPEAITWLIEHEAQAVVDEDLGLIKEIFAENAIIVDYFEANSPSIWNNPIARYQPLFKDYQFIDTRNTNIRATGPINGDTVEYISGSHGSYRVNGQTTSYKNPDDASRWKVTKINGCWKITRFEFNVTKY
jgi:hypothetical protein